MWIFSEIEGFYINVRFMELCFVEHYQQSYFIIIESISKLYRIREYKTEKEALEAMHEIFKKISCD